MLLYNDNVLSIQIKVMVVGDSLKAVGHVSFMLGADPQTILVSDFVWIESPVKGNVTMQKKYVEKVMITKMEQDPVFKMQMIEAALKALAERAKEDVEDLKNAMKKRKA